MTDFENASIFQLNMLLGIVETKKNRNWNWLIDWMDGKRIRIKGDDATAENVIEFYENDRNWND